MSNYDECEKDILEQIEDALRKDPNRIGDVFRSWEENEDDYDAIASDLGWESTSTVYAYMNYIDGIFQDFETDSPGKAIQVSRQINSFLKRNSSKFDKPTLKYVESAISFYDEISKEEKNVLHEGENSITKLKEIVNKERIYVYSYPHYVNYPHIPSEDGFTDERYMLKIGRTTNSVLQRVYQQRTAMPEDPVLYFVFGLGESDFSLDEAEKKVHDHLNVIGHRRASNSGGGREWFLTNFDSVLSVAEILKLELEFDLFLEEDAEESDTPD